MTSDGTNLFGAASTFAPFLAACQTARHPWDKRMFVSLCFSHSTQTMFQDHCARMSSQPNHVASNQCSLI